MTIKVSNADRTTMPKINDQLAELNLPSELLAEFPGDCGTQALPKEMYFDREFNAMEQERLWKRVWQMACFEQDIPNVGDFIEYEICDQSVLVVRTASDSIQAFHNVCLHRGTRLATGYGTTGTFDCTFHAWSYGLDGKLLNVPCQWDFPQLDLDTARIPPVRVETWNGFVFINLDPDADPLSSFLGKTIPKHFERWPLGERYKAVHIVKAFPCNWKLAMQAFLEVYHVFRTHPQFIAYASDANARYDIIDELHGRMMSAHGTSSPHAGDAYDDQAVVDAMITDFEIPIDIPTVAPGESSRAVLARVMREHLSRITGGFRDEAASDSEMLDSFQYFVFPNLIMFGGYIYPLVQRCRPNGNDPESCLFDVVILVPMSPDQERPLAAQARRLADDEPWASAMDLGTLGPVFDQDVSNMGKQQKGLRSDGIAGLQASEYQEKTVRNLHVNVLRYLRD